MGYRLITFTRDVGGKHEIRRERDANERAEA